jgi:hypothetical protein
MRTSFRPNQNFRRRVAFGSPLDATILRMIGTNSLAAFAQSVAGPRAATPVRGPLNTETTGGRSAAASPEQRPLDAVPPQPAKPLPRGSLLDLRV